jgi:hypothetical protein
MQVVWGPGAIGNAVYTGCLLRDVLHAAGVTSYPNEIIKLHAAFESVEQVRLDTLHMFVIEASLTHVDLFQVRRVKELW